MRRRSTSLSPPDRSLLEAWGRQLDEAFGELPYLVGSVARAEEWRDVDVRLMLDDDDFLTLVGEDRRRLPALNLSISLWGRQVTALPIDFQLQDTTEANAEHAGPRVPLGIVYERA